ncbi:MAG: polysaccharide biosynthesis C-terminal domain-containing protein [Gaiellaceae bacterium]
MTLDDPAGAPLPPVAAESRGVRLASAFGVREAGRVLRDFVTYLPTQIIPAIAGFLVLPILARQLAPTELGVLAIAQTLITLSWIVSAQWLGNAIMRELPASRASGELQIFSATLLRGLGIAALLLAVVSAGLALVGLFAEAIGDNLMLILAAAAGLVLHNVALTLFASSLRPRAYVAVDVLGRTGGIALGVVLVFEGHKVHGYLLGVAVASCLVGALGLWAGWPRGGSSAPGTRTDVRAWALYGAPLAIGTVAVFALLLIDRYLLAALKDTAAVGVYSVGAVLGDKAVVIPTFAFFTAARPLLVTAFERDGRVEVERLMRAYTRIVLLIGLPVVAMAAATAGDLVPLLAGGDYEEFYEPAAAVVPIVAGGSLLYALSRVGETGLVVAKRTRPFVAAAGFALTVNIVANVILIPPFGIKGAAIATPIGNLALLLAVQFYARRHATWRFPYRTLVRGALAAGAGYGAARLAMELADSGLARVALAAAAGGAAYLAGLALLGERRGSAPAASA